MKNRRYAIAAILTLMIGTLLSACRGEDCVINNTVTTTMGFCSADGNAIKITDELTVSMVRPGSDSIVLNRKTDATEVSVPLGYATECDTFVFRFSLANIVDTVFLHHTNQPYFISLDCGTAMFHTLTSADCTHNALQSVVITNPEINYDALENLQLVFRN